MRLQNGFECFCVCFLVCFRVVFSAFGVQSGCQHIAMWLQKMLQFFYMLLCGCQGIAIQLQRFFNILLSTSRCGFFLCVYLTRFYVVAKALLCNCKSFLSAFLNMLLCNCQAVAKGAPVGGTRSTPLQNKPHDLANTKQLLQFYRSINVTLVKTMDNKVMAFSYTNIIEGFGHSFVKMPFFERSCNSSL